MTLTDYIHRLGELRNEYGELEVVSRIPYSPPGAIRPAGMPAVEWVKEPRPREQYKKICTVGDDKQTNERVVVV